MSNILIVTGGCGFIGSNFIHHICKKNKYKMVVNVEKFSYAASINNLKNVSDNCCCVTPIDITNINLLNGLFRDWNHYNLDVIHFAAESHVDNSIESPKPFIDNNIVGTFNLLELSRLYKVNKFVHVSTDEVFGSLNKNEKPFNEKNSYKPNSPYAASKAASDLLVRSYCKTYNFPGIITNCSNNYGPRQHKEKLIPKIISNALQDKSIPVYGDGKNIRDWLYVEDHCEALSTILEHGKMGESYCIGGDCEKTNIEIVKQILNLLNKPLSLIKHVEDRKGHDYRYSVDFSKLKSNLKWQPKTSFKEGIKKTIEWYSKM